MKSLAPILAKAGTSLFYDMSSQLGNFFSLLSFVIPVISDLGRLRQEGHSLRPDFAT